MLPRCPRFPPSTRSSSASRSTTGPACSAASPRAIGEAGGSIGAVDLIGIEGGHTLRDITIETAGEDHAQQIGEAVDPVDGARTVDITDRTFQMHVGGKIETRIEVPDPHPRRPQPRLHARRRPRLHRDPQGPRPRLPVHDQAQHGRRGQRRQRGPRPRRHRPRGRDARDGGQGRPVQGVRRRRRLPDLPVAPRTRTRSSRSSPPSPPASAASTSRTSAPRAASRSRTG